MAGAASLSDEDLAAPLLLSFYSDSSTTTETTTNLLLREWSVWIRKWIKALVDGEVAAISLWQARGGNIRSRTDWGQRGIAYRI